MYISLTDMSAEPLHQQLYRQIRAAVLSGDLEPGYMLPSIRTLAKEQRVSVITIKSAYENLERDGFILARRGKGFFIKEIEKKFLKKIAKDNFSEKLESIIKNALQEGIDRKDIIEIFNKQVNEKESLWITHLNL